MEFRNVQVRTDAHLDKEGLMVMPEIERILHFVEGGSVVDRVLGIVDEVKKTLAGLESPVRDGTNDAPKEDFGNLLAVGAGELGE